MKVILIIVLGAMLQFVTAHAQTGQTTNAGAVNLAFDTSNGPLNSPLPQVHSGVLSVLPLRNGQVVVGGLFLQVEGLNWPFLARLNADGSLDQTFTARPNSIVRAMLEQPDGKIVIAGEFNGVNGQFRDRVARLEPDGNLDTNFTVRLGLNGVMYALAAQADGKVVLGGAFHVPRVDAPWNHNLIRLETNGAIDVTFNPGTNFFTTGVNVNHVKTVLVQPDGGIIAGGTFCRANGSSRDYIARLLPDGSLNPRFGLEPLSGPNGPIHSMTVQAGGLVVIGGSFTRVHDVARTNLARLLPDDSVDESFAPLPLPMAGFISSVAADSGGSVLVIHSALDSSGNLTGSRIFRYDASGRLDTNYVSPTVIRVQIAAPIYTVVPMGDGGAYIGGTFETVDGAIRRRVALLVGDPPGPPIFTVQPADMAVEPALDLVINASVTLAAPTTFQWYRDDGPIDGGTNTPLLVRYAMPVHSGNYWLVASNAFGSTTSEVAAVTVRDPQRPGAVDLSFVPDPGANSNIWTLAETDGGQLVIGGDFTQVDRSDVTQIARLNADGRLDESFRPTLLPHNGTRATVRALFPRPDGRLIVGGDLRVGSGAMWSYDCARIDPDGQPNQSFIFAPGLTFSAVPGFPRVRAFAIHEDGIVLGGTILAANGQNDLRYVLRVSETGDLDTRFRVGTQSSYYPSALASDAEGRVLVGSAQSLVRLTTTGRHDSSFAASISKMDPCPGGSNCGGGGTYNAAQCYHIVAQPDGKLLVGGYFERVNNVIRSRVARLNSDGSLDSTFLPPAFGASSSIYVLAPLADGRMLVGGAFSITNADGVINGLARLNQDGSFDPTFKLGRGPNADVRAILVRGDGKIVVGGRFTRFNGYQRGRVAVLHGGPAELPTVRSSPTNTAVVAGRPLVLTPLVAGYPPPALQWLLNGIPVAGETGAVLRLPNARIGDSGTYSLVASNTSGISTSMVAVVAVNAPTLDGGVIDPGFFAGLGTDKDVNAVVVQKDGRIVVGGAFTRVHGVPRAGIARLLADGSLDDSFDPGAGLSEMPSNGVAVSRILLQPDGKILVGGNFSKFDGVVRNYVVRLRSDGKVDLDFPNTGGWLLLVQPDGKLLLGGYGTYLRRLFPDGTTDAGFRADTNLNDIVRLAASQTDGKILVVGDFYRNIARLMPDGSHDDSFDPNMRLGIVFNDVCFAVWADGAAGSGGAWALRTLVVQPEGRILLGGAFSSEADTRQWNLVRLLPSGASDPTFTRWGGPNFAVRSLAVQRDGKILIGGCFTNVGDGVSNVFRSHIARLNADGSADPSFNPGAGFLGSGDGWVDAIALQPDGRIVLGGQFSHVDGVRRNNIACLGSDVQMFDPATDGQTFTTRLATVEGRTYWLEYKTALADGDWTVASSVAGDGTVKTLTDTAVEGGLRFYRVRAE